MEAFKDSDVIGVSPYCLENKEALPEHLYWKITLDILQQHISPNSTKLCHMNVHLRFLRDKYYDRLLRGQKKLYYVSCRNLDEPLKRVFGISEVHSFIVAPQMNNDPSYVGIRHFPEQFVQVKSWIENLDCTGSLCLVGAGYVGKIYNIWFKRRGGVALDVGSIFDQWAGRRTRGKNCNKAYCYDDTYKL